MHHRPVHLIRQIDLRAPFDLLEAHGVPIGEILERAGAPEDLREPGDGFLPARQLLAIMADGAECLGLEDFAFRAVLRAPGSRVGSWGELIPRCWRLRDAMRCFAIQVAADAPFDELGVHCGDEYAWLWRKRHLPPKDRRAERQGEMYVLGSMIEVVRAVAGRDWAPPAILIESPDSDWILRSETLQQSRSRFGAQAMAIAVPYELLDLRLSRGAHDHPVPDRPEMPQAATDLKGSLQQALAPLVGRAHLSLELGAEIAEVSPRTLRRWLREEGTNFQQILDRVLFEAAEQQMKEPDASLTDVAAALGYANSANFARAFHRWTGESPGKYRSRRSIQ